MGHRGHFAFGLGCLYFMLTKKKNELRNTKRLYLLVSCNMITMIGLFCSFVLGDKSLQIKFSSEHSNSWETNVRF